MEKEGNMISEWLDQNRDPEIEQFVEKNLAIAEKVNEELRKRGWSQAYFAQEILSKTPSEVSRWLSGLHNLTLKSIIKMEIALGIDLIHTEAVKEYESVKYIFLGVVENQSELAEKASEYQTFTESQEYPIAI